MFGENDPSGYNRTRFGFKEEKHEAIQQNAAR